jgi:glutamine phosphoribosylpyrophosphate amidotransferase
VFSACHVPSSYLEDSWRYKAVEGSVMEYWPASNGKISIAKIRYHETSSENIAEAQPLWRAFTK